jgi:hypothetical protein
VALDALDPLDGRRHVARAHEVARDHLDALDHRDQLDGGEHEVALDPARPARPSTRPSMVVPFGR